FFSKYNVAEKYRINREMISLCVPEKYEEHILSIYTRTPARRGQIQRAARRLIDTFNRDVPSSSGSSSPLGITPNRALTIPTSPSVLSDSKRRRLRF
ncbi:hypothetical protein GGF43_004924, partial [Coemansia sp. RSA 2618]